MWNKKLVKLNIPNSFANKLKKIKQDFPILEHYFTWLLRKMTIWVLANPNVETGQERKKMKNFTGREVGKPLNFLLKIHSGK